MSEEISEPTPQKTNRRLMALGGVSAVLIGCCALLAVVALILVVDPFGLNIFTRLTGRYDAAATVMPADAEFYVGVNLLNLDPQEIGRITQPFIAAADNPQVENLDSAQNEFSEEVESELGVNIETDIVPWIGQYLGFGVTQIVFDNFGEVDSIQWILAAETRNKDAADEFLLKLRDGLTESSGNTIVEQTYEGATLYAMQSDDPEEQIAFGRSGNLVIVGKNVATLQTAIDAQNGDSLDESEGYKQVIGDLPRGRALTVYLTGSGISSLVSQSQEAAAIPVNPSGLPLANFASSATTVAVVDAGLQIDMVSYFAPDQLTAAQQEILEASSPSSRTAELFPDQTLALVSGQRLDLFWTVIREATGDVVGFDESMDAFGREFGVNPSADLLPLLNGEWAIGVIAGQSGLLSGELDVPLGFSVVAATDNPLEMNQTVEAIRVGLEEQRLFVSEVESNSLSGYQVRIIEDDPPAFSFGLQDGYFFIASSEETAVETFAGGPSLAESERYQTIQAEFSSDFNLAFYLDVSALLGTFRESQTGFDLQDFNEAVRLLEPIEALALGNAYDNNIRRTQIIVFIETE